MLRQTVLDNGIRILTERMPHAHSATIGFWVDSGSRHDPPERAGLSHLVEHMLFKGTPSRSARDIARQMDVLGGLLNAFTSREYTCYYAKVLARKQAEALELLSDIFLNSLFDEEEMEKERRVILQEIGMAEDAPDDSIHDLWAEAFWRDDALGRPVIGSAASVAGIDRAQVLAQVTASHVGRRLVVAAAGDVDHEALVAIVSRHLSHLPPGTSRPFGAAPRAHAGVALHPRDLEQVHLCLGVGGLPYNDPDRYALHLLNLILGGSMSSRLFQEVREKRGLAYAIYSYLSSHTDAGALAVYAGCQASDLTDVLAVLRRELERLRQAGVEADELHAAKQQLSGNLLLSLESTDSRMCRLARNEILLGQDQSVEDVVKAIDAVTGERLLQLAVRLMDPGHVNLQILGPVADVRAAALAVFPVAEVTL